MGDVSRQQALNLNMSTGDHEPSLWRCPPWRWFNVSLKFQRKIWAEIKTWTHDGMEGRWGSLGQQQDFRGEQEELRPERAGQVVRDVGVPGSWALQRGRKEELQEEGNQCA